MASFFDRVWDKIKRQYLKIVLRRFALAFILFSVVHCVAQGAVQSFLFSINSGYSTSTSAIVKEGRISRTEISWLTTHQNNLTLKVCDHIPGERSGTSCETVFQTGVNVNVVLPANVRRDFAVLENIPSHPDFGSPLPPTINPAHTLVRAGVNGTVDVSHDNWETSRNLNEKCVRVFVYANEVLNTAKREDLVFVFAQIWLLAVSYTAVLKDSLPLLLGMVLTRILATAWSAFEIWQTLNIERQFGQLIFSQKSPCNINIYPAYFGIRIGYGIFCLCLNASALVSTSYFGLRLVQGYQKEVFVSPSPPRQIVRIYRYFAAVQVCLQPSLFMLLATIGLWIDQMVNGAVAKLSTSTSALSALFASMFALFLPWTVMGWYSLRNENKRTMEVFLCVALVLTSGWASMFYIAAYRWTFVHWPFLASLTIFSFAILMSVFVFGIVCRVSFGEGLSHYLYLEGNTRYAERWRKFKFSTYDPKSSCPDITVI